MRKVFRLGVPAIVVVTLFSAMCSGQSLAELALLSPDSAQPAVQTVNQPTPAIPAEVSVPAGTRVLMVLTSPLHSTSGAAGSGVYLETVMPVIDGNRVVIPAHTFVEGVVEGSRRPGHFNRASEFRFRFTTMIFPNNSVAPIDGVLESVPGSKTIRSRTKDSSVATVDQAEKVMVPVAAGAAGGALVGSVDHFGVGKFVGAGLGAGLGLGAVLLHRGDAIDLPQGTHVEMTLKSEIKLTAQQASFNASYVAPPPTVFPAPAAAAQAEGRRKHPPIVSPSLLPLLGGLLLR